ncbi:MAG: hypothetical protein KJO82_08980 [Gammaproteobacteria bacterium]|nr:hypothetical protein [Gammaproteobacteria bacterium]
MSTGLGRYANELISLTVLALMASALIAGQADATVHASTRSDAGFGSEGESVRQVLAEDSRILRAGIVIEVGLDGLTTFEFGSDAGEMLIELVGTQLANDD